MNIVTKIIGAGALLALFAFCLFGFMATFEPLDTSTQWTWRLIYGTLGLTSFGGIVFLARCRKSGS